MGSCISKCKPKKPNNSKCQCVTQIDTTSVKDKLVVISQPTISSPNPSTKPSKFPLSIPNSSLSTASSCSSTTNYPTTSSSSSSGSLVTTSSSASSLSSSTLSSKLDRSFSNDYLWSCVKENPQAIRSDYVPINKVTYLKPRSSQTTKCYTSAKRPNGPKHMIPPPKQQMVLKPLAQKRPRCGSPSNLTRQKSFRLEIEPESEPNGLRSRSGRVLRPESPSHSRRFNREPMGQGRNFTSSMRRENSYVRSSGNSKRYGGSNNMVVKKKENEIKSMSSKIEQLGIGGSLCTQNMDLMPIEDENNPHIALDCFIFL